MRRASTFRGTAILWLVAGLVLCAASVWHAVLAQSAPGVLRVAFLDVGQGDAVFIETPQGRQMLIDGGAGRIVLSALAEVLAYGDRTLDVVLATHPDLDHIGGLPEVFARYDVGMFIEPCVADDGADYTALTEAVVAEELVPVCARQGMRLELDTDVFLEIFFPDRDARSLDANMGSVVARLTYGETSFLLTGDSPLAIETYLVDRYGTALKSDVLKLGHHGSKTSTSDAWVGYVAPSYAIVSAGCDNQYGHPHQEVLDRLTRHGVEVQGTCEEGTIVFESDGVVLTNI